MTLKWSSGWSCSFSSGGRGCGDESFLNRACLHTLQPLSTEIHQHCYPAKSARLSVCLSVCPHAMMMWREAARQNNTSKEKQEAKPTERVYRGGLHVAPVSWASKTRSVWCGFTEFHYHEILLCGCTGIRVGVRIGVINRCTISAISVGMYIWCMDEGIYEQDVRSRRRVYCPTPPLVFAFKMANSIKRLTKDTDELLYGSRILWYAEM